MSNPVEGEQCPVAEVSHPTLGVRPVQGAGAIHQVPAMEVTPRETLRLHLAREGEEVVEDSE